MPHHEHERRIFRTKRHDHGNTALRVRRRVTAFLAPLVGIAIAFGSVICGCFAQTHPQVVYAFEAPPSEPIEVEGGAPGPSYTWVRGNWYWNGVEYIWIPGHWQSRPHAHAVWTTGRWHRTQRGWVFTEGHWT